MNIGPVGLWTFALRQLAEEQLRETVAELEQLGYAAIWFPGGRPGGAFSHARAVLEASSRIVVATGIVSIWGGEPSVLAAGNADLVATHPGRFLFGIGVSHPEAVNRQDPGRYTQPLAATAAYIDALDAADPNADAGQRVLAALGPRMLALAADRTAGAHPYFVPVEHTAFARKELGAGPLLAPEQAVVVESDPTRARQIARGHMALYLQLSNYTNNLRRFGYTDDDISGGGSDRLVDAIVAWGSPAAIAERVRQHHDAGADHVCLQVLAADQRALPVEGWRALAAELFG